MLFLKILIQNSTEKEKACLEESEKQEEIELQISIIKYIV